MLHESVMGFLADFWKGERRVRPVNIHAGLGESLGVQNLASHCVAFRPIPPPLELNFTVHTEDPAHKEMDGDIKSRTGHRDEAKGTG